MAKKKIKSKRMSSIRQHPAFVREQIDRRTNKQAERTTGEHPAIIISKNKEKKSNKQAKRKIGKAKKHMTPRSAKNMSQYMGLE